MKDHIFAPRKAHPKAKFGPITAEQAPSNPTTQSPTDFYYTLRGSDRDGYSLNVYKYAKPNEHADFEVVTTHWSLPKPFSNLKDAIKALLEVSGE